MTKDFVDALAARYVQAGDEQKASLLFGIEATPASSLSIFCCQLPEIDLARIEAIKAAALAARLLDIFQAQRVVGALLKLVDEESDDEILSYVLQALAWYPEASGVASRIAPLLGEENDTSIRDAALAVLLAQKAQPEAHRILESYLDDPEFGAYIGAELQG